MKGSWDAFEEWGGSWDACRGSWDAYGGESDLGCLWGDGGPPGMLVGSVGGHRVVIEVGGGPRMLWRGGRVEGSWDACRGWKGLGMLGGRGDPPGDACRGR